MSNIEHRIDFSQHHKLRQWPNVVVPLEPNGFGVLFTNTNFPFVVKRYHFEENANLFCNELNKGYWRIEQIRCESRLAKLEIEKSEEKSKKIHRSFHIDWEKIMARLYKLIENLFNSHDQ